MHVDARLERAEGVAGPEVRALAAEGGLSVAEKDESFEVELSAVKKTPPSGSEKPKKRPSGGEGIEAFE